MASGVACCRKYWLPELHRKNAMLCNALQASNSCRVFVGVFMPASVVGVNWLIVLGLDRLASRASGPP